MRLVIALSALVLTGCGTFSPGLEEGGAGLILAAPPGRGPEHAPSTGPDIPAPDTLAATEASPADRWLREAPDDWQVRPSAWKDLLQEETDAELVLNGRAWSDGDGRAWELSALLTARSADPSLMTQAPSDEALEDELPLEPVVEEYDPWEPFNETMFAFNLKLDRYVVKPIAKAWNFVLPDEIQRMIGRAIDNVRSVPRIVNNVLQGKFEGAGRETARLLINSVVGIGGLWDMAKQEWGILKSDEDFGQTLGAAGSGPGAYLILPFLPPLTVRDGIGRVVDIFLDPLTYLLPTGVSIGITATERVNDRALNLELFEGFEETTLDLYSAVRNAYLARRKRQISE